MAHVFFKLIGSFQVLVIQASDKVLSSKGKTCESHDSITLHCWVPSVKQAHQYFINNCLINHKAPTYFTNIYQISHKALTGKYFTNNCLIKNVLDFVRTIKEWTHLQPLYKCGVICPTMEEQEKYWKSASL